MSGNIIKSLLLGLIVSLGANLGAAPPASAPASAPARIYGELPYANPVYTGDLDGMIKRRLIRVLVVYSKTHYWVENGQQRGASYEALKAYEDELNKRLKTGNVKIFVLFVPTRRDQIIPALLAGRGDIAAAGLTITPERLKQVDFTTPTFTNINEVIVTGPNSPKLAKLEDLAGQSLYVRKSSSYWTHLQQLNQRFAREKRSLIRLEAAAEELQDEDLLEMVNSGLLKAAVVDDYKAKLWAKVLPKLQVRSDLVINANGQLAMMMRKNSPQLKADLDAFIKSHGQGTTFGNTILKRYLGEQNFVKNALQTTDLQRFESTKAIFQRYGKQYQMDYLLMMAQGYQESRLDQQARSHVGAIGVMQLMPATGKEMKVGDVRQVEPNIHAGVKYIRFMIDQYYAKEPMNTLNKGLFAFASYNAGAGRISQLRKEASKRGLDPNKWFNNVEVVAAEKIGPETVTYVSSIFKYYIAYTLLMKSEQERQTAKQRMKAPKG
ncbi:transglycosylase SLT domain-containing protein [Jeongeupia chitinilytica]|uniref:Peptidoglycan lytic exotransglycosylase n=1 Tax=Jeongeupia chitinilytica TaxID=1041641 RepID=A0ABQ3H027_9NEIS|nr:transporter substrate-binding domain-containing protein [Jeongeupia chitinilytica]GHD59163.1 peptidoglycan lytic exotransglycosylase [Jeongeupia chitinilytica]